MLHFPFYYDTVDISQTGPEILKLEKLLYAQKWTLCSKLDFWLVNSENEIAFD